jgi:hypothetical protein
MKSPNQVHPKSTPKPVSKKTCCDKVASGRITPTSKTTAKPALNQCFLG